jgi:hypothetical protein
MFRVDAQKSELSRGMSRSYKAVGIMVLFLVVLNLRAETVMDMLTPGCAMRHAVFPFYRQPDLKLSTVVRVEKACLDYEHNGFFHIGLLPVGALEGVTIEICDPGSAADSFEQMQRWLDAGGGRRVELRQVKFLFSTNSLEAGTVRCGAGHRWELRDGVRLVSGGHETRAQRATFQISGREAGQVILRQTPQVTNSFLGLPGRREP